MHAIHYVDIMLTGETAGDYHRHLTLMPALRSLMMVSGTSFCSLSSTAVTPNNLSSLSTMLHTSKT